MRRACVQSSGTRDGLPRIQRNFPRSYSRTRQLPQRRSTMAVQRLMVRANVPRALALAASTSRLQVRHSSTGPANVTDASFWKSLVPKPLRRENRSAWNPRSGQWNPATFFIVMFLFIGSMSIQMIALRNSFDRYRRQSTLRIARLREVVDKIQRGEEVDVEKVLGTGDAKKEADWEESTCPSGTLIGFR